MTDLTDLPDALESLLEGYDSAPDRNGRSSATVLFLESLERPPLVLKIEPRSAVEELPDEAERLAWLGDQGLPCPEIRAFRRTPTHNLLLMTRVPGEDLSATGERDPQACVLRLADALRRLHALPVADCPFGYRLPRRLEAAAARIAADAVDLEDFYAERTDETPAALLERLRRAPPSDEDLVVTHGDACTPNFVVEGERPAAYIDCGRLGVADRHQDLALAARTIESDLGPQWLAPFYARYGAQPDPARLEFYRLMDEFF